jgi:hypothetical protein
VRIFFPLSAIQTFTGIERCGGEHLTERIFSGLLQSLYPPNYFAVIDDKTGFRWVR